MIRLLRRMKKTGVYIVTFTLGILMISGCASTPKGFFNPQYRDKKVARVAVVKFNGAEKIATAAADRFSVELLKSGVFDVFERQQVDKILQEQGFSMTGVTEDETRRRIGRLANVEALVIGDISQYAGMFNSTDVALGIKIVDIETGATIYANSAKSDIAFATKMWTVGGAIDTVVDVLIRDVEQKFRK